MIGGYNTLMQDDQRISQIFKNPACRNCVGYFAECSDVNFCDFFDKKK